MNRKRQQAEMVFLFGQLLGPLLKVVENPDSFDKSERIRTIARYHAESQRYRQAIRSFCSEEPGHDYMPQFHAMWGALDRIERNLGQLAEKNVPLEEAKHVTQAFLDHLLSIPVPVDSAIHAAHTPFSSYRLLRDCCGTAQKQVVFVDRYLDHRIFHRFLADTARPATVSLVTWPESRCMSVTDKRRYKEFMDISAMFAQERGPARYRLVTNLDIHARFFRCDDNLFNLGDSLKALGEQTTFTISKLDSTPDNFRMVEELIEKGAEVFGPSQQTHPS